MFRILSRAWQTYLTIAVYELVLAWWIAMRYLYTPSSTQTYYFNFVYGLLALIGVAASVMIAFKVWGGWKSMMGRMLIFIGVGLFMEWLGICVWLYYNLRGIAAPYPSVADVGYFGLVPMYVMASVLLARATGVRFGLKGIQAKLLSAALPLVALTLAFALFIRKIGFSEENPLKLFFDLAYPIGEIIPVTVAVLVLVLATRMLRGGVMRGRVVFLVAAFFAQFVAEYVFLYQAGAGTYVNAGTADLLYATSYLTMCISIFSYSRIE
jgi:hypothetical protein